MADFISTDCKIYLGKYDFSAQANSIAMDFSSEIQDATAFGDTTRVKAVGLANMSAKVEGFFEAGVDKIDTVMFSALGVVDQILTLCPTTGANGERAFLTKSILAQYNPINGGNLGEMLKFSMSLEGRKTKMIGGTVLKNGTVSVTGDGTGYQLGAISAAQSLYAAMHVTAVSGTLPELTVKIQSDDNAGFTSATDRVTFTLASDETVEWKTLAGAITDTYWRAVWTVGGTLPSFSFVCSMGIK